MTTPPPDNPWKKRKQGAREFMPPSRALYAEKDGKKATATWCYFRPNAVLPKGLWQCTAASGILKWMKGYHPIENVKPLLKQQNISWHWIEPNTAQALKPPF